MFKQSMIPKDGKPLCITLYADKTRLSSFGTAQGYPIMAQLNNLPQNVRNGKGLGSTQVVGWLPIVDIPQFFVFLILIHFQVSEEESDKSDIVDFKRTVWHKSFEILLESISLFSVTGYLVNCGDDQWRRLYPFIYVLAADYEEQYVMQQFDMYMMINNNVLQHSDGADPGRQRKLSLSSLPCTTI